MVFEVGKFYKHTDNSKISVLCKAETYYHGNCLLAETNYGEIQQIGETESHSVNYKEISKEEFII